MAGIGFELRKLLGPRTFASALRAYGYAGLIGAGPWVLSVAGTTALGTMAGGSTAPEVVRFLVAVTWIMAGSLILTGPLQLLFSRFIADRVWEEKGARVAPNLIGALCLTTAASGALALVLLAALFGGESLAARVLLGTAFVAVSDLWIAVVVLGGLQRYRTVLFAFAAGYGLSLGAGLLLRGHGLEGLLASFMLGQSALFFALLGLVLREYPSDDLVSFEFLSPKLARYDLAATGALYNLAIWADKLVFWLTPQTSARVLGPLRYSVVYDLPIFLAYLSVIPGSAVFLLRLETDFAESHHAFYEAIRRGGTLQAIEQLKDEMVLHLRRGLAQTFKVQALSGLAFHLLGPALLPLIGISTLYLPLFDVDLIGAGLQVLLLCLLNVLFYFDRRREALGIAALFATTNLAFSAATVAIGPQLYGYGFCLSAALGAALGLGLLARTLDRLEFETFMLQA